MQNQTIQLAHGGGGRLQRDLIRAEIESRFGDGPLRGLPDAATVPVAGRQVLFTTDSFVVHPLVFPGGSIGDLAVFGTVNDLAVSGAVPRWLSVGLILEEGLDLGVLRGVLDAIRHSAGVAGVCVVTGDTKVVRRGQCDGLYVNTAGIGEPIAGFALGPEQIRPGDRVLVSGPIGDHGMAVLACREGIDIRPGPVSDTGPVHRLVQSMADHAGAVRFMRDPTRGGVAAVLNEMVEDHAFGMVLDETAIPRDAATAGAAEILGLDLLQVACEGRLLAVCAPDAAEAILAGWRCFPEGHRAAGIGTVTGDAGLVLLETLAGGRRLVDVPRGELLPRIC